MSQQGQLSTSGSGGAVVEFLTGNSGGPVGPDGSFNINVIGNNTTGINVVGMPGTNTLTIVGIQATSSQRGTVTLASDAEAIAGTDTINALTSSNLAAKLGTQTAHSLAVFEGTSSALTALGAANDGEIPIGSSGLDPVLATLTAGTGISVTNGPGSITITAIGTANLNYTAVNFGMSPYIVLVADQYLGVTTTGGIVVIKLPNATSTGKYFIVKDVVGNAATNKITVTTVGGVVTIDGATSYDMIANYQANQFIFNGSTWEIF